MDRVLNIKKKKVSGENFRRIVVFLVVCIVIFCGIQGTYRVIMNNAQKMGQDLVSSYAADEERTNSVYEMLLRLNMAYLKEVNAAGVEESNLERAVLGYFDRTSQALGYGDMNFYAVINEKLVTQDRFEGMDRYDYTSMEWYQKALQGNGEIVYAEAFSNSYSPAKNNNILLADPDTGCVILISMSTELIEQSHNKLDLPDKGAYYLFDNEGRLLYEKTPYEVDQDALEMYAASLHQRIDQGDFSTDNVDIINDIEGMKRGVYFAQMENDWLCILTVPRQEFVAGLEQLAGWYGVFLVCFLLVTGIFFLHDHHMKKSLDHSAETIRAVCNFFQAIYRINVEQGTYEMVKGSEEFQKLLDREGNYDTMLRTIVNAVDSDTARQMEEAFSLEHVRSLVARKVGNFGGDFRRELDGQNRWIHVALILGEEMEEGEAVLAFRLVDTEKERELQQLKLLQDTLKVADASEQSQTQFFANVSHEMRTPLNTILGMCELAGKEICSETERRQCLKRIDFACRSLMSMIDNILEISRLEKGHMPLEKKTFNLCEELSYCIRPFQDQAAAEGKSFEISYNVEKPLVEGDPTKMNQIISNLLSNAVKYTRSGDQIRVMVRQAGINNTNYIFTIEDTGIGMSEQFLPRLFEPYAKENRFGTSTSNGNGLGMAIVRNLVSQKNGQISVESKPGEGTRFIVTLPFMPGQGITAGRNDNRTPEEQLDPKQVLRHMRILLVEDNDLNREILSELLIEQGAVVTSAADGQEAVEIFERSNPYDFDTILMDMQMPRMDGCKAAEAIRKLDRKDAKEIFIIALTANAFSEDVQRTAQAGMNAHLAKPADLNVLARTLQNLIDGK